MPLIERAVARMGFSGCIGGVWGSPGARDLAVGGDVAVAARRRCWGRTLA
jgi:hypothetical protein